MENNFKDNLENQIKVPLNEVESFLREYEVGRMKNEFTERVVSLLIVSLGLITALAWGGTIEDIFAVIFNGVNTIPEKIIYSLSVTLIAVVTSAFLSRFVGRGKTKK